MLTGITAAVSGKNMNIDNLMNKSRGDYACTIIDTDGDAASAASEIAGIDGVIRVRVIK